MPKTFFIENEGDALKKIFRRLDELDSIVKSPDVMGTLAFGPEDIITVGGILIGESSVYKELVKLEQDPVTGVITLTPGAYMNDIFIDVSWTAVADAASYDIEMTKVISPGVYSGVWTQITGANNIRFRGLEPNTTYGFRIYAMNHLGIRSTVLPSSGYTQATTSDDTTIPPPPSLVFLYRGASTAVVQFLGLTKLQAPDVANGVGTYRIQLTYDPTWAVVLSEQVTSATIVSFPGLDAQGTYYARVQAIDKSGNASGWVNAAAGVTAGGVVDSMIISGLNAAKITFGTMDGDRITVNTLSATTLETSTLSAASITLAGAGQFLIGSPPTNGIAMNVAGIRAYKAGVTTFWIDASGNATFEGAVNASTITGGSIIGTSISGGTITGAVLQTSASARRVKIEGGGGYANTISFYASTLDSEYPGRIYQEGAPTSGTAYMLLTSGAPGHTTGGTIVTQEVTIELEGRNITESLGTKRIKLYANGGTISLDSASVVTINASTSATITTPALGVTGDLYLGGALLMGAGVIAGTYDGNAAALRGVSAHAHTFSWYDLGGGEAIYQFYVDTSTTLEAWFDGSGGLDFYWGGGYVKTFVINHPTEMTKYLVHATVEGPEARVEYVGIGELDSDGEAWVTLPEYFEALTHAHSRHVEVTLYDNGFGEIPKITPTYPVNGMFHVRSSQRQTGLFSWKASAVRKDVPQFDVEPLKSEVSVRGDGPYTYIAA